MSIIHGPGFIRIDSVHQGDLDGRKGLYHINAVACVTQWEVVASVQTISEAHLLPVIAQMLGTFSLAILGFRADNGSEYVNHKVAAMLSKLHIEFTRSRPRRSNDNGLAEIKNGGVVRKLFGYEHIPQDQAAAFNTFCRDVLNPFLNFHRPRLFASDKPDPCKPGRVQRICGIWARVPSGCRMIRKSSTPPRERPSTCTSCPERGWNG